MRIFISQPMTNRTDTEITKERQEVIEIAKLDHPAIDDKVRFAKAVNNLSQCYCVIFPENWIESKISILEHDITSAFGIMFRDYPLEEM